MRVQLTPLLDTLRLQKISDEEYFSDNYKFYISNSRLGLINPEQDGSAEKFFKGFSSSFSQSFALGTAVHELVLQNDLFEVCYKVDKPTAKLGVLADLLYPFFLKDKLTDDNICKCAKKADYYKGELSPNRIQEVHDKCTKYWEDRKVFESDYKGTKEIIYLDPRSKEIVGNCVKALSENKKVQDLLHPQGVVNDIIYDTEQAILLDVLVDIEDSRFVVRLKSKLDHYSIDTDMNIVTVNDVKTIGRIVSEITTNISKFHYNREIAMYSWLISLCAEKFYGLKEPIVKGNYLAVSTIPQYYTKVLPMNKKMYDEGWSEFVRLLKMVAIAIYQTKNKDFAEWISE
jgi:hypothetical protein